jgi:hypothetical protein
MQPTVIIMNEKPNLLSDLKTKAASLQLDVDDDIDVDDDVDFNQGFDVNETLVEDTKISTTKNDTNDNKGKKKPIVKPSPVCALLPKIKPEPNKTINDDCNDDELNNVFDDDLTSIEIKNCSPEPFTDERLKILFLAIKPYLSKSKPYTREGNDITWHLKSDVNISLTEDSISTSDTNADTTPETLIVLSKMVQSLGWTEIEIKCPNEFKEEFEALLKDVDVLITYKEDIDKLDVESDEKDELDPQLQQPKVKEFSF